MLTGDIDLTSRPALLRLNLLRKRIGRPMTAEELERVLRRYPGDIQRISAALQHVAWPKRFTPCLVFTNTALHQRPDVDPLSGQRPRFQPTRLLLETEGRESFIGRHDRPGSRRGNPEPCSRPEDQPRRSGAMVRRVGAICSPAWRGSESIFLGRRARVDRRPARNGHGRCFGDATASPSREEVHSRSRRRARSRPGVLRLVPRAGDYTTWLMR
jgi:hypothetical protein